MYLYGELSIKFQPSELFIDLNIEGSIIFIYLFNIHYNIYYKLLAACQPNKLKNVSYYTWEFIVSQKPSLCLI